MKTLTVTFHSDPGHGWLEVDMATLQELGVDLAKITTCSYRLRKLGRDVVFLEEDCDAGVFLDAAKAAGWEVKTSMRNYNYEAMIRFLPRFRGE